MKKILTLTVLLVALLSLNAFADYIQAIYIYEKGTGEPVRNVVLKLDGNTIGVSDTLGVVYFGSQTHETGTYFVGVYTVQDQPEALFEETTTFTKGYDEVGVAVAEFPSTLPKK